MNKCVQRKVLDYKIWVCKGLELMVGMATMSNVAVLGKILPKEGSYLEGLT